MRLSYRLELPASVGLENGRHAAKDGIDEAGASPYGPPPLAIQKVCESLKHFRRRACGPVQTPSPKQ